MPKTRITNAISMVLDGDCGFEVFVKMKDDSLIKKLVLFEGHPDNPEDSFKRKVSDMIITSIRENYLAEDTDYSLAENVEDNQKKYYAIRHDESYPPFQVIDIPCEEITTFSMAERENAEGLLFRFRIEDGSVLWAYQHIWAAVIPNKKKENLLIKVMSHEHGDVFTEMQDTLFTITPKVDLLIVTSEVDGEKIREVVTANITLMQSRFGFEEFIRSTAGQVVATIANIDLVANTEKLTDYIIRGNKKYARKMMRIKHSEVLQMSKEKLREKATTLDRWKGKFKFDNDGNIELATYGDVENLIDLFDERYCRSDVTGKEYDTSVKSLAAPVSV